LGSTERASPPPRQGGIPGGDHLQEEFPEISQEQCLAITNLMSGTAEGLQFIQNWEEAGSIVPYHARIMKRTRMKKRVQYKIAYWKSDDEEDDCEDMNMFATALAADIINGDLLFNLDV
jgi:hypothetical protein